MLHSSHRCISWKQDWLTNISQFVISWNFFFNVGPRTAWGRHRSVRSNGAVRSMAQIPKLQKSPCAMSHMTMLWTGNQWTKFRFQVGSPPRRVHTVWEAPQALYPVSIVALNTGVKRPLLHIGTRLRTREWLNVDLYYHFTISSLPGTFNYAQKQLYIHTPCKMIINFLS